MATFNLTKYYSKQGLWSLFLICAFPLHIWTLFMGFRDFDWVTARTNSWDAVGVVSYGLFFTFFESLFVFAIAIILGFLISRTWDEKKRIAVIGTLIIILSIWSVANQTYFLQVMSPSEKIIEFYINTGRPLVALYTTALVLVSVSVVFPTFTILRSSKAEKVILEGFDRLSMLMVLYLFLDIVALIIILIRNI